MLSRITIIFATAAALGFTGTLQAQEAPGVAVLDTGTNAVGLNIVGGFNFLNGSTDTSDRSSNNHGTSVSLIINQESPGIPQYQYVVDNAAASASEAAVLRAAANPGVQVIAYTSASLSAPSAALPQASQAGKFVALRTGNGGGANPAPGAMAANGLPGVVLVTGTNGAGGFLPNANACGAAAARCVGVRGTTEFNNIFGTSFSAARLAGIAAEVLKAAPYLDSEELAGVMFATARDTGDPRLGNGFIADANQVINSPAGASSVGGSGSSLGTAALVLGAAAGAALLFGNNDEELEKTLVLDSFGRPFHVDLGELARVEDQRGSLSRFFNSLEQRHDSTRMQLNDAVSLEAAYVTSDLDIVDPGKQFAFEDDPAFADSNLDWVLSLSGDYANGFHYQIDKNRDPSARFSLMDEAYRGALGGRAHFLSGQAFAAPLLSFSPVADSVSFGYAADTGFGLDFGLVHTDEDRDHGRDSVSAVVEGSYRFEDRAQVSLQVGQLREDGSLFGGASNGAFSVDNTETLAASISASLRLGPKTRLIGNYGVARSEVDDHEVGLLQNFSSLHSDWFGVGVVSEDLFDAGDQAGIAFSQPLRVAEGEVDLDVPRSRDFEGNIYSSSKRVSLEPGGREYALESYYLHPIGRHSAVGAYVMWRQEPNHFAESDSELTLLASYQAKF